MCATQTPFVGSKKNNAGRADHARTIATMKSTTTERRLGLSFVGALVLSLGALSGCPASSDEVRPPGDAFFFPTGLAITPDEGSLFILNANSDLRYDSGTIAVVDLERVEALLTPWFAGDLPSGDCEVDSGIAHTLICNEAEAVVSDGAVRTGNFATEVGVQELDDGTYRVFAAVRGDPSLTWLDYDATAKNLECGGSGPIPRCDKEHRLTSMRGDDEIGRMASEPFGLLVDSVGGFVVLAHLTQGAVSLASAPTNGDAPVLSDGLGNVFDRDPQTRVSSALGAAARVAGGRVYVTSRSEERVQMFTVARVDPKFPTLVPSEFFFLRGVAPSDDARGIRFGAGGDRAYIVNRSPAMLQVLDTSLDETGVPRNELIKAVEICANASNLAVANATEDRGERVYVTCFRNGQVWAVDPEAGTVEAIIDVGQGPQSLAIAQDRGLLFTTNFLEDTMAVIDLRSESDTENRVVLKLGRTRQSGGK